MTDRDEQRVKRFLKEQSHEISDNGFTQRVLSRLPERQQTGINTALLNNLWTAGCLLIFTAIWVKSGNWHELPENLHIHIQTLLFQLSATEAYILEKIHSYALNLAWVKNEWWKFGTVLLLFSLLKLHETHRYSR
ncbi:MAG: DUF5056 domain-containing protein [Paraprevotella sp.]|nr:DUF5056 domain-containing protein [Paraprevotella sp.]